MEVQGDTVFQRSEQMICADVASECVILNIDTGRYHSLNEVGTRIWELLEKPVSANALTDTLTDEFDVDAQSCHRVVTDFLGDLFERQLIHVCQ